MDSRIKRFFSKGKSNGESNGDRGPARNTPHLHPRRNPVRTKTEGNINQSPIASEEKRAEAKDEYGIKVLYSPERPRAEYDPRHRRLDRAKQVDSIVFVHGVNGRQLSTWTASDATAAWPCLLLPHDIPDARISAFGYDADVVKLLGPAGQNRLRDHAGNLLGGIADMWLHTQVDGLPILFVVHSLGGLVCENALTVANNAEPHEKRILEHTRAIAFLGTPHRGSQLASWTTIAGNIVNVVKSANTDILEVMKPSSEVLENLTKDFHTMLRSREQAQNPSIKITCFAEELSVSKAGKSLMVVPRESATLERYACRTIHADHIHMTKFKERDNNYRSVMIQLKRWVQELTAPDVTSDTTAWPIEKERECLETLALSSHREHKDRVSTREHDTCNWFLQSSQYTSWRESQETKILWVTANPGCGKTVLAKCLIDEILPRRGVLFFFFKSGIDEQDNLCSALCTILWQLFDHYTPLLKYAMTAFLRRGSRICREARTLWDILIEATNGLTSGEVICVLDAIDECKPTCRDGLLRFLVESYGKISGQPSVTHNMRWLITSRRDQDIERKISRAGQALLAFHASDPGEIQTKIEAEINHFIRSEVPRIGHDLRLEDSVRRSLEDKLLGTVNRTYLWVSLILREIKQSTGVSHTLGLQRILESLPISVTETYERILRKASDPKRAVDILRILQSCRRLLTVKELNHALAIGNTLTSEPEEDDGHFRLTIQRQCGLFITVTNSNKVDFVHATARAFLESSVHVSALEQSKYFSKVWGLPLEKSRSHEFMAKRCMTYLSTGDWFGNLTENLKKSPSESQLGEFPFLHYATFNWAKHVLAGSEERLVSETLELLSQGPRLDFLLRLLWVEERDLSSWSYGAFQTPCHTPALLAASFLGLEKTVLTLLEEETALHSTNDRGATALHLAVWRKKLPIARILLEAGLDPAVVDEDGYTALHIAALDDRDDLVDELLNHGASINARNKAGHTSLHLAAAKGNNKVLDLLLDRGADFADFDARGRSVLHNAIDNKMFGKDIQTIRLLLDRGIRAQEPDIDNMTPLHLAVQCNARDIAEVLLHDGFSIDIPVKRKMWLAEMADGFTSYRPDQSSIPSLAFQYTGYTPLHAASLFGSPNMVKFLLLQGADPNVQGDHGETPLHLALRKNIPGRNIQDAWTEPIHFAEGSLDMIVDDWDDEKDIRETYHRVHSVRSNTINLLLDCSRCDILIRDQRGETPLHAVPYGDEEATEYVTKLIGRGSDVNLRNGKGETAVHLAAQAADYQSLGIFFQCQANLSAVDDLGRNILHHACGAGGGSPGRTRTVEDLLQNDIGSTLISSLDNRGKNCLHHHVTSSPAVDIVCMLLKAGANVRHLDNDGQSPLIAAITSGPLPFAKDVIPILLRAGADPHETGTEGRNLAHLVTLDEFNSDVATFELLMEYGIRIDATDAKGRTVLHQAAMAGTLNRELLHAMTAKWGIDIDARDCDGRAALGLALIENGIPYPEDMFNGDRWDETIRLLNEAGANEQSSR